MEYLLHNDLFLILAAGVLMCVIPTIVIAWAKVRQAEMEATLKRDMLQRGLSAEDIERVLQASGGKKTG